MSLYPGYTTELPAFYLRLSPCSSIPHGFYGTIDALLEWLRDGSLDLRTVPLQEVVEQYLTFLRAFPEDTLGPESEFVQLAATLIALKAQFLAPPREDCSWGESPDAILPVQKEAIEQIAASERRRRTATEEAGRAGPELPQDRGRRRLLDLMLLLREVESSLRTPLVMAEAGLSVRAAMQWIGDSLPENAALAADCYFTQCGTVRDQAAVFLALLELGRQGVLDCHQTEVFAPLWISARPEPEHQISGSPVARSASA